MHDPCVAALSQGVPLLLFLPCLDRRSQLQVKRICWIADYGDQEHQCRLSITGFDGSLVCSCDVPQGSEIDQTLVDFEGTRIFTDVYHDQDVNCYLKVDGTITTIDPDFIVPEQDSLTV